MMPQPERKWTLKNSFALGIAAFPVGLLAEYFVRPGSGLPTSLCVIVIAYVVWWRWDLSDQVWFWGNGCRNSRPSPTADPVYSLDNAMDSSGCINTFLHR